MITIHSVVFTIGDGINFSYIFVVLKVSTIAIKSYNAGSYDSFQHRYDI